VPHELTDMQNLQKWSHRSWEQNSDYQIWRDYEGGRSGEMLIKVTKLNNLIIVWSSCGATAQ
jgi:hypothetical protein